MSDKSFHVKLIFVEGLRLWKKRKYLNFVTTTSWVRNLRERIGDNDRPIFWYNQVIWSSIFKFVYPVFRYSGAYNLFTNNKWRFLHYVFIQKWNKITKQR